MIADRPMKGKGVVSPTDAEFMAKVDGGEEPCRVIGGVRHRSSGDLILQPVYGHPFAHEVTLGDVERGLSYLAGVDHQKGVNLLAAEAEGGWRDLAGQLDPGAVGATGLLTEFSLCLEEGIAIVSVEAASWKL